MREFLFNNVHCMLRQGLPRILEGLVPEQRGLRVGSFRLIRFTTYLEWLHIKGRVCLGSFVIWLGVGSALGLIHGKLLRLNVAILWLSIVLDLLNHHKWDWR